METKSRIALTLGGRLALASSLALATPALAHDTWVTPNRFAAPPGEQVTLDLTSGMAFPTLDYAIRPERISAAKMRLAGATSELAQRGAGPHSLKLPVLLEKPGVATVWIELAPKELDLELDKVQEYLDEIGASAEIRGIWEKAREKRRWIEVYSKHAKTYVRVGEPEGDRSGTEPVGMALEIVPEKDPTALRAGDTLPVRVLRNGQPYPGLPVGLVRQGDEHGSLQTTDAEGRATVRLGRTGRWMLRATDLRHVEKPEEEAPRAGVRTVSWESDFTTLTFEVR